MPCFSIYLKTHMSEYVSDYRAATREIFCAIELLWLICLYIYLHISSYILHSWIFKYSAQSLYFDANRNRKMKNRELYLQDDSHIQYLNLRFCVMFLFPRLKQFGLESCLLCIITTQATEGCYSEYKLRQGARVKVVWYFAHTCQGIAQSQGFTRSSNE